MPTLVVALAAPVLLHWELITVGGSFESLARDLATYFACWIIGYAHRDRLLHRIPGPVFAAVVLLLAGAAVVWLFRHGGGRADFDLNHHRSPARGGPRRSSPRSSAAISHCAGCDRAAGSTGSSP